MSVIFEGAFLIGFGVGGLIGLVTGWLSVRPFR